MKIRDELLALSDPAYKDFQAKLVPTVAAERILGVRTPALRKYARTLARERPDEARAFIQHPDHELYEEMNLHGELIGLMTREASEAFDLLDAFLPHVDNWATCDLIKVPAFKQDMPLTLSKIRAWCAAASEGVVSDSDNEPEKCLAADRLGTSANSSAETNSECTKSSRHPLKAANPATEYVVRFGVVQLMELFLDELFESSQLDIVVGIHRPEYYINMARAWYFSYAILKQPEATMPLFEARPIVLDAWTHNKSLQKARESRRVTPEQKEYFQSLKTSLENACSGPRCQFTAASLGDEGHWHHAVSGADARTSSTRNGACDHE